MLSGPSAFAMPSATWAAGTGNSSDFLAIRSPTKDLRNHEGCNQDNYPGPADDLAPWGRYSDNAAPSTYDQANPDEGEARAPLTNADDEQSNKEEHERDH